MSERNPSRQREITIGRRTDEVLAKSILLEEAAPPKFLRRTVRLIVAVLAGFLVWASIAQLDVVAVARGVVMPVRSVKVIQHLDGGRIVSIDVLDGQHVKQGQVLMRLNPTEADAEYQTLEARYWSLWTTVERLRAVIARDSPSFSTVPARFAPYVEEQTVTFKMSNRQREALGEDIKIYRELSSIRAGLEKDKLVSRVQVLEAKKNLNLAEAELLRFDRKNIDDLNASVSEFRQVENQMVKLRDRLERVEILAPDDGIIQDLKYRTIGGVVPPGAVVMNLVPDDGEVHAEVQVATNDIGFVRLGQPVRLKIGTFDYMRYGTIPGQVTMISPFSTPDDKHVPYFKVIATIGQKFVGDQAGKMTVEPGMTVDADIITDRQSVIRYLMRPFYYALTQGMRER